MDYSQHQSDSENPSGASPWISSPQRTPRASYGTSISGSEPSSPFVNPSAYSSGGQEAPAAGSTDIMRTPIVEQEPDCGSQFGPLPTETQQGQQEQYSQIPPYQQQYPPRQQSNPQQQQQQSREQNPQSKELAGKKQKANHYKLQAKITGLERTMGKKDPILRFDVHTNLPRFRTTQFRDVRRTHSEFVKLAEHLISSNPEALVPSVPPAITSAGAGTDEDEARVKNSLQKWLNNVCTNDILMRDDEMIFFVESDFGYSPVVRMKQPATGVRRRVLKQFAPPPDDTPELQDARPIVKLFYLGTMDTGQKVDRVVRARRALGLAESDFGVKLNSMHVQETHPGLASAYRKLGRTIQMTGDYHAAQGTAEATTLADPLNYHSNDAFIAKETFTNRHILLRDLQQAQVATRARLSAADRLKASSSVRREKVDEAISTLDEAKSQEQYLYAKTQRVTTNLLQEKRKWFARTSTDLRAAIRDYVLRQIEAERRTLATLENVRPDIRSIDASGGLSRLGREAHPATRRASMAASQGPRGDAWSGVQRRGEGLSRSISGSFGAQSVVSEEAEAGAEAETTQKGGTMGMVQEEEDDDRVDARNAASRLAASTF